MLLVRVLPILFVAVSLHAQAQQIAQIPDLRRLSIEELLDIDVTSVSRRTESLATAAAAVEVLTSEDIRRSGVTHIADALRLLTGVQVSQFSASSWLVGVRGFTTTAGNKLLVLIDGRTVYSPLFSGSFWEIQDTVLEDVDRIELIRGPGATLWGSNAVNGIINIVTKSTSRTDSSFVRVGGGVGRDLALLSARQGGLLGARTSYRVFTKYNYRDQSRLASGEDAKDSFAFGRVGFRVDSEISPRDAYTLQGDLYLGDFGIMNRQDADLAGGNLLSRWTRTFSDRSDLQLQVYYDRTNRSVPLQFEQKLDTVDIEFQHRISFSRHQIVWGADYRMHDDRTSSLPSLSTTFNPPDSNLSLYSVFAEDEMTFHQGRITLALGSKLERNEYTGLEIQPNVRVGYRINEQHTLWSSVARAMRTPSRFDTELRFRTPGATFTGSPDFESEELIAYELGYRAQLNARASLDVSTFYNVYDSLRSTDFTNTPGVITIHNDLNARTYGGEVTANYDMTASWRAHAGYALVGKTLSLDPGTRDVFLGSTEGNDARHQFTVRSAIDVRQDIEIDAFLRFVDRLPNPVVPRYFELNSRLAWFATPSIELGVAGQNLLDAAHPEFGPDNAFRNEMRRSVYGFANMRF